MVDDLVKLLEPAENVSEPVLCGADGQDVDVRNWQVGFWLFEPVVLFVEFVVLDGQPAFEQGIVYGFVFGQSLYRHLTYLLQGIFPKGLLLRVSVITAIRQQVIVSVDAIIDRIGGVEGKVFLEEGITKIVEWIHRVCLTTFPRGVQF